MASIRKLRLSDIQLDQKRIRWRAENDKIGFEHITPILDDLVSLLAARQTALAKRRSVRVVAG
jgi:hypothetical protein